MTIRVKSGRPLLAVSSGEGALNPTNTNREWWSAGRNFKLVAKCAGRIVGGSPHSFSGRYTEEAVAGFKDAKPYCIIVKGCLWDLSLIQKDAVSGEVGGVW